ncbi:glycosyltransferase family 2 protein [Gayadomonas joobiniege]|uniref:glycosyltransferase family 2 protein n=1 Tax=Gayadomonas joobiniege TaxID=1234606 RepID=UPI00037CF0B0|nr:glycosyltransferase family 2 protein [Gayadomonas joobiniege]
MNNVCAVVVTFNRRALLQRCIEHLLAQSSPLAGIVVVNNASEDDTQSYLDGLHGQPVPIFPVHMTTNTGGAGGFHEGLKTSVELGFSHSWIMDDDALPQADALQELLLAEKKVVDKYGFLTSKVVSEEGEVMNVPEIDFSPNSTGYSNWGERIEDGLIAVENATFVSVFLPNQHLVENGLPLKEMFIWGDDTEFTVRLSQKYRCYLVNKSIVVHKRVLKSGLSIITESADFRLGWFYLLYRNQGYIKLKFYGRKVWLNYVCENLKHIKQILLHAEDRKLKRIKLLITGLIDSTRFKPKIKYPEHKHKG